MYKKSEITTGITKLKIKEVFHFKSKFDTISSAGRIYNELDVNIHLNVRVKWKNIFELKVVCTSDDL